MLFPYTCSLFSVTKKKPRNFDTISPLVCMIVYVTKNVPIMFRMLRGEILMFVDKLVAHAYVSERVMLITDSFIFFYLLPTFFRLWNFIFSLFHIQQNLIMPSCCRIVAFYTRSHHLLSEYSPAAIKSRCSYYKNSMEERISW